MEIPEPPYGHDATRQAVALHAHMAAVVESSDDAIISMTLEGVIVTWNHGAERIFGYTAGEIVGRSVRLLLPPDRPDEETDILARLSRGERVHHYETARMAKDRRVIEVSLTASPVSDAEGRLIGASKILRDITERKRAEQVLKESEERFRKIADSVPQMMWTAVPDGKSDYCNARWLDYTGMSFQQSLGWGWQAAMHPQDIEVLMAAWGRCHNRGTMFDGECRVKRGSDGIYRWFLIRGVAIRDSTGAVRQWIGTCTDIDDQKRALEIEAARLEAETANRAKSQFLANMSHEIRTPMTAILGYADMLLEADQTPADRENAVRVIRSNGAHLLTVINDILDLSKIEAGEMRIESIPCSPCQILAEITSTMRVRAKETGLKFELKIDGPIPKTIRTDPTRLRQILINLTGNAVKFTESGWVRLAARQLEGPESPRPRIRFEVVDSGIGMTPQQISRLFQPFVQADNTTTRRFGGTGLGLTVSQRLAKALGGEITVDSALGRGSLFALTIETGPLTGVPMIDNCAEALGEEERPATASVKPQNPQIAGRVLLAEDGPDNQALLSAYLRKSGAEVVIADNGRIAVEKVTETLETPGHPGFDLILMDMQMPELDGYGATIKLRRIGYTGPIIALTAHAMADDRDRCLKSGCTDYLSKPIRRDDLLKAVRSHMSALVAPAAAPTAVEPAQSTPQTAPGDDEILKKYRPLFVAGLPHKVGLLLEYMAQRKTQELAKLTHQLVGSAGLYECIDISRVAALIQEKLRRGGTTTAVEAHVGTLIELIREVEGYDRSQENTPQG